MRTRDKRGRERERESERERVSNRVVNRALREASPRAQKLLNSVARTATLVILRDAHVD